MISICKVVIIIFEIKGTIEQNSLFTDPLFSLRKVHRARAIKNKDHGGLINRQRKGVALGEEENRPYFSFARAHFARALADVSKTTKRKIKRRLCAG